MNADDLQITTWCIMLSVFLLDIQTSSLNIKQAKYLVCKAS